MKKKTVLIFLISILLIGLFLRMYKLGSESFWLDESGTAYVSQQNSQYILNNLYSRNMLIPEYFPHGGDMPLYYLLASYWNSLFGLSEFKLRILSVLFGTILIYAVFLVGKAIFNSEIGLVAAFIISINHQHIYYSQEARMYSLLILLTLLSVYFLINALKNNKKVYWISYVASTVLLLYTHYFSFFILFFEAVFILIYWKTYKKFFKEIFLSALSIFLLYLPWMPVLIKQFLSNNTVSITSGNIGRPTLFRLVRVFVEFNSGISPDFKMRVALRNMDFLGLPFSGWVLILFILLITMVLSISFVGGILFKNKKFDIKNINDKKIVFLLIWFLMPLFTTFIISFLSPLSIFGFTRYMLYASPAYYIIASKGILNFGKYKNVFLIFLIIFSIFPLYSYYFNFDKVQWRESANYIQDNREDNELILINAANTLLPFSYYYSNPINVKGIKDVDELKHIVNGKNELWLILSSEKYSDPKGTIKSYLDENYRIVKQKEFVGVKIFYYSRY